MAAAKKPPGSNNATYGPVPEENQLFRIEYLEIAPTPLPEGWILPNKGVTPDDLANAELVITSSVEPDSGGDPKTWRFAVPFRTAAVNYHMHLAFRDAKGNHVDGLTDVGSFNDVLADCALPPMFVTAGTWTFVVEANLPDERCLFSWQLTQQLNGELR